MRSMFIVLIGLALCTLAPPALADSMKSTAPEKMLPRDSARKMRACDNRAVRDNVPMEQRAAFVKKCMKEMK